MKKFKLFFVILIVLINFHFVQSQNSNLQGFALSGKNPETVVLKQTFTKTSEIVPFDGKASTIFGLAVKADITFTTEKSKVKIVLVDKLGDEYLVYEAYPLLEETSSFSIDNISEETAILNAIQPKSLRIEVADATVSVKSITYSTDIDQGIDVKKVSKDKKNLRNIFKIQQINKSIKAKGLAWVAGETEVSSYSYAEKKKLYGQSTLPSGQCHLVKGKK
jgi:hypothetical protein